MARPGCARRLIWATSAVLVGIACESEGLLLIPLEIPAEVDLIDLAVSRADTETHTGLFPLTSRLASPFEVEPGDRIELSGFSRLDFEAIGAPTDAKLLQSKLRPATPGEARLPAARLTFSGLIEEVEGFDRVVGAETPPLALTADWCEVIDPCRFFQFEARVVASESDFNAPLRVLTPISEEEALAILEDGSMFIIEPRVDRLEKLPLLASPLFTDATSDGEGVWLHRGDSPILRRFHERELTDQIDYPFPPLRNYLRLRVASSRRPAPFELFVLDDGQRLSRFDGEEWTVLLELPEPEPEDIGMVWEAPGQVVFFRRSHREIVRVRSGVAARFELEVEPRGIQRFDRFGTLVGTDKLGLYHSVGDEWRRFQATEDRSTAEVIRVVELFGAGFIYGSHEGRMGMLVPDHGLCLPRPVGYWSSLIARMTRVGGGVLMTPGEAPLVFVTSVGDAPTPRCPTYPPEVFD